ncbi:helix-hairpin-helix domain-containing protein [Dysgonomonas sp. 521]|uniref:helix-hairpin-helix domain-containing protein n=1 Tax=Dysgonomonas sp. 521 TaxID=2302932 RepID=UPI0013D50E78|nr:helix-hairpin-helix domain-containing protein [Dysgonomonas sp. 521]NDV96930.1 helix-hairpin-helix domain-containing protein [Dysgonomonas sp. 521]
MKWKDYLYIQKGDRVAIILLLILIVVAGGICILTSQKTGTNRQLTNTEEDEKFRNFAANLKDRDTSKVFVESGYIYKDEINKARYPKYIPQEKLKFGETVEINSSDTSDLKKIPGIGSGYANRIVKYRNLVGGFYSLSQLKEVWGIDDELYNNITPYLTITPKVKRLKVNHAPFEELNRHPYINYKQAKVIADIRERKGNIESINRLSLLDEFTEADIRKLSPYLSFE